MAHVVEAVVEAGPVVAVVGILRGVEAFSLVVLNADDVLFSASVVPAVGLAFELVPAEVLAPAVVTEEVLVVFVVVLVVSAQELLD